MRIIDISKAESYLSELLESVLQGNEVIISKAGKPVAKLVALENDVRPRQLGIGQWRGQVWIADDFDDLPEDDLKLFTCEA